jgi:hypothetical protein
MIRVSMEADPKNGSASEKGVDNRQSSSHGASIGVPANNGFYSIF